MRKILLSLFACTTAFFSFANSYDTLYVKGGDPVFYPVGLSQAEMEKVEWFIGDTHNRMGLADGRIARSISKDSNIGFQLIQNAAGDYHLSYKVEEEVELTQDRLDYHIFCIPKSTVSDPIYNADFFRNVVCDTLVYIHRYNELESSQIAVDYGSETLVVNAGQSVDVKVSFDGWSDLDVEQIFVVSVKEKGSEYEILDFLGDASAPGTLTFEAKESLKIGILVKNEISEVLKAIEDLTVIPDFEVTSISYETITNGTQRYSEEFPGKTDAEFSVTNRDEVTLMIHTNVDEINEAIEKDPSLNEFVITYSWNKGGVNLPENANILEDGSKLVFSEYDKQLNDGVYNCILASAGEQLITVTFVIASEYATNNDLITENEPVLYVAGNTLFMNDIKGLVRVYNINGKLVQTIKAVGGTSMITLNHPQGIYIITCESHTVKAIVR